MLFPLLQQLKQALQTPLCRECGLKIQVDELFCFRCQRILGIHPPRRLDPKTLVQQHSATLLTSALKRRLYGYKFYARRENKALLADLLICYWKQVIAGEKERIHPERILVLPIPAHEGMENRVEPVAQAFAQQFGYDYQAGFLRWNRNIAPQHRIFDRSERARNIAFSLEMSPESHSRDYKRIIVIDDLTTTGATLREAVRAIRSGGEGREYFPSLLTLTITAVPLGLQATNERG